MATLVFSTVGNALGGPVGGAIGALIGQSFDQQLLSPTKRGPRLGDLNVQTSTYGTQIPRLYGSMRVAGTVVWATDLVESEQSSGAKGQPDVTYSYSVSLAVSLSSRVAGSIGRIWADGQLLRGAAGDFKVPTTFRFYDGREDQQIDPLIGSTEGIANTPAYRGLALAVFENLELATFGNRIPFMTFEVVADARPVSVSAVLKDASGGTIDCSGGEELAGFAAYGASVSAAVAPLVESFGIQLFDDGVHLRAPVSAAPVIVGSEELGCSADAGGAAALERQRLAQDTAPGALRLNYYDPSRDYQTGEARALSGEQSGVEVQRDLAVVMTADDAKSLAHSMVAREWSGLDRLTLRLPPSRLDMEPGTIVRPAIAAGYWSVEKTTIEAFVTTAELRRQSGAQTPVPADGGRAVAPADVVQVPSTFALIDIPNVTGSASDSPIVLVAASAASSGWRAQPFSISGAGIAISAATAPRKSVLGTAVTCLGDGAPDLIDARNCVDVQLLDAEQWLTSCDDDALASGINLAVIGDELVQFASATALGEGRFRLERLLRGRGGTEWASGSHAVGETFCLLDAGRVAAVELPLAARGATITLAESSGETTDAMFDARWVRPLRPVHIAANVNSDGALSLSWLRRSRSGFAWLDDVDTPIGEAEEQYRVTLTGAVGQAEFMADQPNLLVNAAALGGLGRTVRAEIVQLGDCAASLPASITIEL